MKILLQPKTWLWAMILGEEYGINEVPPDFSILNKPPKLKDCGLKEGNFYFLISNVDRQELYNNFMNFHKERKFDNQGKGLYKLCIPEEEIKVRFESRFENGNLKKAIKVTETEYNLILSYDYNTNGHTQWFYFQVISSFPAGTKIKFNILNLMKPDSLYNYGMKPWVLSEKHQKEKGIGWHRDWSDISYKVNELLKKKNKEPAEELKSNYKLSQYYFFTLSFTYTQLYDNDKISFAHAIPYTYNDNLLPFIKEIGKNKEYHKYLRVGTLCMTLARNEWKILTITDQVKSYRDQNEELKW